jgi:hypothetical protein
MTLPAIKLTNKTVLLDVSHVKQAGDDLYQGGILIGKVQQSEIPTYGYVVQADEAVADMYQVGMVVPIPTPGVLRVFEWPGKSKDRKIVAVRAEALDGVIAVE